MIRNQQGYTLVEVLVASVIGSIAVYIMASFLSGLNKMNVELRLKRVTSNAVQSFAENIRFDTTLFQTTFDNSGNAEDRLLKTENLPLGITKESSIIPKADCNIQGCTAYMGYVIVPHEMIRNLYSVHFLVVKASDTGTKWEQTYYITVK